MRRTRDTLDVRLHAAAHVKQQEYIYRHVLLGEVADVPGHAFLSEHEVRGAKSRDCTVVLVHHLCIHTDERDLAFEDVVVSGLNRGQKRRAPDGTRDK